LFKERGLHPVLETSASLEELISFKSARSFVGGLFIFSSFFSSCGILVKGGMEVCKKALKATTARNGVT